MTAAARRDGVALRFTVPGPPVGKARARIVFREAAGKYGAYTPETTTASEHEFGYVARSQMCGAEPMEGPLKLRVVLYFPIPASWSRKRKAMALEGTLRPTVKPDVDNCVKLIKDSLNKVVWRDDAQIVDVQAKKLYDAVPRTLVIVEPIGGD